MSHPNLPDRSPAARHAGFRAVLSPHRSLSPAGFLLLMSALGLISFVTGMAFMMIGAWPVLGFFGLDVALVYLAFRLNYRAGRLHELVEIEDGTMTLTRIHPSGRRESFDFNPYWVRVSLQKDRWDSTDLRLASHGHEISFGRFLTDEQKLEFADTLQGALVAARGGPRI